MVRDSRSSQPRPDYNRIMARVEKGFGDIADRLETLADSVNSRMSRIEHDVATNSLEQGALVRELAEARRDASDLRDGMKLLRDEVAKGTLDAAGIAADAEAARSSWQLFPSRALGMLAHLKTWWGWAAFAGAVVVAIVTNLPPIIRFGAAVFTAIGALK